MPCRAAICAARWLRYCVTAATNADRACDSDPLRERLKKRDIELIIPYRSNNKQRRY
jgi:hypothetical protein